MAGTSKQARRTTDAVVMLLADQRKKKGYSLLKLAKLANISQTGLTFIERGDRRPTLEILIQLATALEIDLWPLLRKAESEKVKKIRK
jgi:transcriptional regulator with XRE-family HTH domain